MDNSNTFQGTALWMPSKARALLRAAVPHRTYGPTYNRNIDAAAADLEYALENNRRLDTWAGVLALRLDAVAS